MATLRKMSVHRLSSLFSFSSVDLSINNRDDSQPNGSRSVSTPLQPTHPPPPPPVITSMAPDSHQPRSVSAQLHPPAVHVIRKAVSSDNLSRPRPSTATTSRSRPSTPPKTLAPPTFVISHGAPSASPPPPSPPGGARSASHAQSLPVHLAPSPTTSSNRSKRKSWFGGGGKLTKHREEKAPRAWIAGEGHSKPYPLDPLLTAQMVSWGPFWQIAASPLLTHNPCRYRSFGIPPVTRSSTYSHGRRAKAHNSESTQTYSHRAPH
jgi:hypothetical protein